MKKLHTSSRSNIIHTHTHTHIYIYIYITRQRVQHKNYNGKTLVTLCPHERHLIPRPLASREIWGLLWVLLWKISDISNAPCTLKKWCCKIPCALCLYSSTECMLWRWKIKLKYWTWIRCIGTGLTGLVSIYYHTNMGTKYKKVVNSTHFQNGAYYIFKTASLHQYAGCVFYVNTQNCYKTVKRVWLMRCSKLCSVTRKYQNDNGRDD